MDLNYTNGKLDVFAGTFIFFFTLIYKFVQTAKVIVLDFCYGTKIFYLYNNFKTFLLSFKKNRKFYLQELNVGLLINL